MELTLLQWNESFRVGVATIDRQHQRLFDMINGLARAIWTGKAPEIIGEVLVEMAAYADEHFKSEQLYLEKHPNYPAHLLRHWEFTKKCMALVMAYRQNQAVSKETLNYLSDWLRDHVLQEDRRDFRELREQGLLPEITAVEG